MPKKKYTPQELMQMAIDECFKCKEAKMSGSNTGQFSGHCVPYST